MLLLWTAGGGRLSAANSSITVPLPASADLEHWETLARANVRTTDELALYQDSNPLSGGTPRFYRVVRK